MKPTAKDLIRVIGCKGYVRDRGMNVNVTILDARISYGNLHVLIAPISGTGSTWTTSESVILDPAPISTSQDRSQIAS